MTQPTQHPIHIGKIVRHAMLFNSQRWQGEARAMDDLLQSVEQLFALLEERKLPYVLVGGIALLHYIQGRNTEDIDLIFNVAALQAIPEIEVTYQSPFFARGTYKDLQIDFLLSKNPLFAHVQKHHVSEQPFFERKISAATVNGLILLKLYALPSLYRQGDFTRVGLYENDIATLMFYYTPSLQELLHELTPFVSPQDMSATTEIVAELEGRIARFRRTSGG
ncbi:hypothetical protein [Candidatus Viridilinea mediisalina]|uniref:Nucleotidyltransferase n=1 Tax=Candidatus Viridilinea mediisalina TaxID=2024553 RepID=A0A2A6RPP5_9CHLR|nr:hypothetical protein [Candidatus Viridilinea mediisalina]PDW04839.1 hypothetical protein CJ255_01120 [Candidatus Viridilinea mediisalina]